MTSIQSELLRSVQRLLPRGKPSASTPVSASPLPDSPHGLSYRPQYLTHVSQVYADGRVDLPISVYFPRLSLKGIGDPTQTQDVAIQVQVEAGPWHFLSPPQSDQPCWTATLTQVPEASALHFRYRDPAGTWQPFAPLTDLESFYGTTYVPRVAYQWENQPPRYDHAKVLLETTLEGLLAGYKGGKFAARDLEELLQGSVADRILKTDIPGQLATWNIDEVMVPVCASVANRSHLDPKFNYLTYNFIETDWQIGNTAAFKKLVDRFYAHNIQLIPDLIFAHQVRTPFAGSLDQIQDPQSGMPVFVDPDPFLFRDYGTWMFRLEDAEVRRQLIEKFVAFVRQYRLKFIRLDYLDGLILQYSNRSVNFGAIFLQELRTVLKEADPEVRILGETFEAHNHWVIQNCVDVFYAPAGFAILEELYSFPWRRYRPLFPDIRRILPDLTYMIQWKRPNAFYAQLHDETCPDEHIASGRPQTPWAYGHNPAELAKRQGEALIQMGQLQPKQLLNYVRRMVRGAEALTLFSTNLLYMFVPAVDSLTLGSSLDGDHWKVQWQGVTPEQLTTWRNTGLTDAEIFFHHDQHRADMITLRQLFRCHTLVDPDRLQPLTRIQICHNDAENAVLGLWRSSAAAPESSLLVLFNFGDHSFHLDRSSYECPLSDRCPGTWEVMFDGDWVAPERPLDPSPSPVQGYAPGTVLRSGPGEFFRNQPVLTLNLGARSLLVLKYHH